MLNEFGSVVISSNEVYRKLMGEKRTCFAGRRLPDSLIEFLDFNKQGEHVIQGPGDSNKRNHGVCILFVSFVKVNIVCVSV